MQGFVISSFRNPVPMCTQFEAQLMIVELLEHNPIFTVRGHGRGGVWCKYRVQGARNKVSTHTCTRECLRVCRWAR